MESKELKKKEGALFVGRLSQEKGIATMLDAWHDLDISLRIAGGGHFLNSNQENRDGHIKFLGQINNKLVAKAVSFW